MKLRSTDSLLSIAQRRLYKTGDIIFMQGDRPTCAYIVRSGLVRIANIVDGNTHILATIIPNQVFGELALVSNKSRTATAMAIEPTELVVVTAETFKEKIGNLDTFMKYWVNYLIKRIVDLSERIDE